MRIKTQQMAPFYYHTMLMSSALSDIFMLLQLVVGWKQYDRQCTYNNIEACSCNHCCSRRAI